LYLSYNININIFIYSPISIRGIEPDLLELPVNARAQSAFSSLPVPVRAPCYVGDSHVYHSQPLDSHDSPTWLHQYSFEFQISPLTTTIPRVRRHGRLDSGTESRSRDAKRRIYLIPSIGAPTISTLISRGWVAVSLNAQLELSMSPALCI